jgi:cell division septation protein DedD
MNGSAVRDINTEGKVMPNNVEGEFELVLGNKQLMSVFFIVVVLLGVFFAMGYVVGRNLAPETASAAPDKPIEVASALPKPVTPAAEPAPAAPVATAEPPAAAPVAAPPENAKPSPIPAAQPKPVEVASAKPAPPAPKPEPAKPAAAAKPTPAPAPKPVSGGMYLQVGATTPDKVEKLTKQLSSLGFRSTTQAVPDSPLVRVLAGPFDSDLLSKAKQDLESAGIKSFPRKL